jgi:hypothetical protein
MSGIKRRTLYVEHDNRPVMGGAPVYRPYDWAVVETGIGAMVEPGFLPFTQSANGYNAATIDAEDMIRRIDVIENISLDNADRKISGNGDSILHGGVTHPRTGR